MDLSATSVKIIPHDGSRFNGLLKFELKLIKDITLQTMHLPEANFDLLWHAAWIFAPRNNDVCVITSNNSI